ncbi:hypothetical protein [Neisseria dentiae]|uniref:hypothetical protein n=1 Tax=Neisseria dentiae TaxID=194197 RepID=UPI0035A0781B
MVKYILACAINFVFLTSAAYAENQSENVSKVIYQKEADLNQDGKTDRLLIEENSEGKRSFKILLQDSKKYWNTAVENHNMILCRDCGGVSTTEPLESVEVKRNSFEVTQEGGSREKWTSTYKFQYSPKLNTWVLKKAKMEVYDTITGKNSEKRKKINRLKPIKLQDFNYDETFNSLTN